MGRATPKKHGITGKKRMGHRHSLLHQGIPPGTFDVVLGKGPGWANHPGNERYLARIASCSYRYDSAKSVAIRRSIRIEIVDSVRQKGGRFVRFDEASGAWTEVRDTKAVHDKISMSFRNYRRPSNHRHGEATAVLANMKDDVNDSPWEHCASQEQERCQEATASPPTAVARLEEQTPRGESHGALLDGPSSLPPPERHPPTASNGSGQLLVSRDGMVNQFDGMSSLIEVCKQERAIEELRTWVARELLLRLWLLKAITKTNQP